MFKSLCMIASAFLAINLFFGYQQSRRDDGEDELRKIAQVMQLIESNYVESNRDKIGYEPLMNNALNGMLQGLDVHSAYLPPIQAERIRQDTEGTFAGIGILIDPYGDPITVQEAIPGSPAMEAGLQKGDHIRKVDDFETKDKSSDAIIARLKGEIDTATKLRVYRPALEKEIEITVKRANVKLPSVLLRDNVDGIQHILITTFNRNTTVELYEAIRNTPNVKALILDVRFNPGGLLGTARSSCELFLPEDLPIVKIVPRRKEATDVLKSRAGTLEKILNLPMVILINNASASGSEILAGCLRDNGVATLIGEKTFGKASVQTVFPLHDGSSVKLTTAHYYTPSEKPIHGIGISPDIEVKLPWKDKDLYDFRRQLQRFDNTALETDKADPQLEAAIKHLRETMERKVK